MKKWNQVGIGIAAVFATLTPATAQPPQTYLQKTRTFHSAEAFAKETGGKLTVERRLDEARLTVIRGMVTGWPVTDVTVLGPETPSGLWVGTKRGAIRFSDGYRRQEYFAGMRWLPDDLGSG